MIIEQSTSMETTKTIMTKLQENEDEEDKLEMVKKRMIMKTKEKENYQLIDNYGCILVIVDNSYLYINKKV